MTGTFPVTPGDVLSVYVAGDGGHQQGGFGYGHGGDSDFIDGTLGAGGGGGSAVVDGDDVVLLVAGGGGGAGIRLPCADAGAGGDAGQDGGDAPNCPGGTVPGGLGGTAGAAPGPDGTTGPHRFVGGGGGGGGGFRGGTGGEGQDYDIGIRNYVRPVAVPGARATPTPRAPRST